MIAENRFGGVIGKYYHFCRFLFFGFLFLTLVFGRSFSVLHVTTGRIPIFSTEIVLLLTVPLIFFFFKDLKKVPRGTLLTLLIFFTFGAFYFFQAVLQRNFFGLRDITLCGYPLFAVITFLLFRREDINKRLLPFLIVTNIFALMYGFIVIQFSHPIQGWPVVGELMLKMKPLHLGLYCGVFVSFFIAPFPSTQEKGMKMAFLFFSTLDLCFITMLSIRAEWIATAVLFIYFFIFLFLFDRKNFGKFFLAGIAFLIIISVFVSFSQKFLDNSAFNWLEVGSKKFKTLRNIVLGNSSQCSKKITPLPTTRLENNDVFDPYESSEKDIPKTSNCELNISKPPSELLDCLLTRTDAFFNEKIKTMLALKQEEKVSSYSSIIWRLLVWRQTIMFTKDSFFWGKGFGVYPQYKYPLGSEMTNIQGYEVDSQIIPTHNEFLTILLKMGLIGVGLFVFLTISVVVSALVFIVRCRDPWRRALMVGVVGAMIFWHCTALFFDIIDSPPTSFLIWVLIGIAWRIMDDLSKQPSPS